MTVGKTLTLCAWYLMQEPHFYPEDGSSTKCETYTRPYGVTSKMTVDKTLTLCAWHLMQEPHFYPEDGSSTKCETYTRPYGVPVQDDCW